MDQGRVSRDDAGATLVGWEDWGGEGNREGLRGGVGDGVGSGRRGGGEPRPDETEQWHRCSRGRCAGYLSFFLSDICLSFLNKLTLTMGHVITLSLIWWTFVQPGPRATLLPSAPSHTQHLMSGISESGVGVESVSDGLGSTSKFYIPIRNSLEPNIDLMSLLADDDINGVLVGMLLVFTSKLQH